MIDADWSVELGHDDDALEMPWSADDHRFRYVDLKRQPESITALDEAMRFPELRHFLAVINAPDSPLETAKCDVWSDENDPELETVYGAPVRFGSYVDVLFAAENKRFSFELHERLVREVAAMLADDSGASAQAEFIVRRCYYHAAGVPLPDEAGQHVAPAISEESRTGFYITFYAFGFGDDVKQARHRWAHLLTLAAPVLLRAAPAPLGTVPDDDVEDT